MSVRFLEDLSVEGDVSINQYLLHNGDLNTFFGFPGNDTASIGTNGFERMRITSNGNIGIGTTSPAHKLDVNGSLSSGQLYVNQNAGALNMVGTDHTYMQWYPAGLSGGRHAYTGFAGGGTNHFTIANETSGANINLTTNSGTVNVTGNLSVSGTIDGVDIGANYANWNTAYGWGNHASAGYLLKSGGTMTGTLQAATLEGASFTNRFRKMSVLPGGYIEPNALNFRFDESQTAYAGEAHGIGGTISQTSGTTIPDASLKRLFTFTSSYINLNTYKDASNNVVVELTNIALSNSANTSWRPYVFFHSAASSVASMTIELKDGDNNWETVENAIDCVDFYMYDGFYTLSPGILRGARFTFTNITGNSYLRMIGVIGKTVEPYQWNVLKSGSKMFGDLDFADSKKATFGNSGDLDLLHDGSNSYIHHNGAGSLYMKADTGDINIINYTNDRDITLQSDNGSGGTTPYITLDGSAGYTTAQKNIQFVDNAQAYFGTGVDLRIYHDGSNSYIKQAGTGDLYIQQTVDDKDIIFQSDDGSGGTTAYLTLDGSVGYMIASKAIRALDSVNFQLGASADFTMQHNGVNTILQNYTGNLEITQEADDGDIVFKSDDGSGGTTAYLTLDGSTTHSYFSAGNVGIGTTSPDTLLEVSKSTGAAVRITSTATGNGADVTLGSLEYYGNDASVPGAGVKSSIVAKTEASLGDDSNLIFSTSDGTTNNIERLRINSSGNVGIGTTSPSNRLEIVGPYSSTPLKVLRHGDYGNVINLGRNAVSETANIGYPADATLNFSTSGSERMRIDSSGNVGIGTASPNNFGFLEKVLNVSAGSSSSTTLQQAGLVISGSSDADDADDFAYLSFTNHQATVSNDRVAEVRVFKNGTNVDTAEFAFYTSSGSGPSERMRIGYTGNVGINTASPTEKLHVEGRIRLGSTPVICSHDNVGIDIDQNNNSGSNYFRVTRDGETTELFRVQENGNVGIGTTSPDSTLDVNGAITLSGASNEIIKSYGSIRLNIDSDNNQGDRIFIVSTGSNSELFRVDEGGHGEFQGNATVNGSVELGHASDTTIARASAGKVTIEGAPIQTTQMSMSHHNFYFNTTSTTIDYFVPFNSLTESSNPTITNYYGRMVAPYDGRIVKAVINTTAAIGTTCSAQFWVATSAGVFAPSPAETVSNINLNTANTAATATFSGTSTAEFSEGDVVGLSIQKSGTTSTAYIQVTIVWEYTV